MRLSILAGHLDDACELVAAAGVGAAADPELAGVSFDSRRVRSGDLYCALDGARQRGRDFLDDALRRGAVAMLMAPPAPAAPVPLLAVRAGADPRRAAGRAAAWVAGRPSERLWLGAVTGTNGKTTVVHLLAQALSRAGLPAARAGTLGLHFAGLDEPVANTTPAADVLQDWLARVVAAGARAAVLEASSHGLDQGRLAGLHCAAAGWTNLSRDHLDYHGDLGRYADAKARLVHELAAGAPAFLPAADERVWRACRGAAAERLAWGLDAPEAALRGRARCGPEGLVLEIEGACGQAELHSRLLGRHNAANLLLAFGLAHAAGLSAEAAASALAAAGAAPGRLERVALDSPWLLFVDYAHTPDALERVLAALREACPGRRVGLVFGAGGDRDAGKRPAMGAAAARGADWCVVTSDNPRSEDPGAIVAAVAAGARAAAAAEVRVEVDRRAAIRQAVAGLRPGEVLLVAGKGHESYQEIGGERFPFDDRRELEEAARCSV